MNQTIQEFRTLQVADGCETYPPFGADTAAWETHRIALALSNIDCHSEVVTLNCKSGTFRYTHLKIGPTAVRNRYLNKVLFSLALRIRFKALIESRGYNIIHYHCNIPAALTVDKAKTESVATIVTWGDPYLGTYQHITKPMDIPRLARGTASIAQSCSILAQLRVLNHVDRIISVSRYLKNRLRDVFGVKASKVDVVPPGVDTVFFKPGLDASFLRERYSIHDDEKVIMCPARIAPLKRQEDVILAASSLRRKGRRIRILFVGTFTVKSYLDSLMALARKLDVVQAVTFTGIVPDFEFPSYYNLADLIILPSIGEGLASSLIEAMSCGRPIVASDIPPNLEIAITGKEALFFPRMNTGILSQVLEDLIDNPSKQQEMSYWGRKTAVDHFSWRRIAEQTLQVYDRTLSNHSDES